MATIRRVVIDPNVLVSAAISPGGVTAAVVDLIDAGLVVGVVSPKLLAELDGVLRRDKFRRWLDLDEAVAFVAELERLTELRDDPEPFHGRHRIPTTTTCWPLHGPHEQTRWCLAIRT